MKTAIVSLQINRLIGIVCVVAALLLNVACTSSTGSDVWSNADYSSGSVSPAPKVIKSATGLAIMN